MSMSLLFLCRSYGNTLFLFEKKDKGMNIKKMSIFYQIWNSFAIAEGKFHVLSVELVLQSYGFSPSISSVSP